MTSATKTLDRARWEARAIQLAEEQAELRRASAANRKAGKAPYEGVKFETTGELLWIARQLNRSLSTLGVLVVSGISVVLVGLCVLGTLVELPTLGVFGTLGGLGGLGGLIDLRKANLQGTNLQGVELGSFRLVLQDANVNGAYLEGVDLSYTVSQNAALCDAHLEGADFTGAILHGADLSGAHLKNTNFSSADLRGAKLDSVDEMLKQAIIDSRTRFDKVTWKETPRLHDESGKRPSARAAALHDASRVYREVGRAFREHGLSAQAAAYRQLELAAERKADFWGGHPISWVGSGLLNALAGYGYRPLRTLFWYLVVIGGFAFAYSLAAQGTLTFGLPRSQFTMLPWYEALILSVSSFHGRGFFQPVKSLGDPVAILAAVEAVLGLFIEISFIATFTQRYFGSR